MKYSQAQTSSIMSTRRKYRRKMSRPVSLRSGGSMSAPVHMKNTGTAKRARLSQKAQESQSKLPGSNSLRP